MVCLYSVRVLKNQHSTHAERTWNGNETDTSAKHGTGMRLWWCRSQRLQCVMRLTLLAATPIFWWDSLTWTGLQLKCNQPNSCEAGNTHTAQVCVHVDREWRKRRRNGSIPHWLTTVFVVHLNKVCHIHRFTIPTHTHTHRQTDRQRSQISNHINATSTHRAIHNAQGTEILHKHIKPTTLHTKQTKHTHTHTHCTHHQQHRRHRALTWLAWLCTCDPFPQHPATLLSPTVLDPPGELEVCEREKEFHLTPKECYQ